MTKTETEGSEPNTEETKAEEVKETKLTETRAKKPTKKQVADLKKKKAPTKAAAKKTASKAAPKKAASTRTTGFDDALKIKILAKENPRREGSDKHAQFELARKCATVGDYRKKHGDMAALKKCVDKGWIKVS